MKAFLIKLFRSFRYRLLGAFSVLIALLCMVAAQVFYVQIKEAEIHNIQDDIEEIIKLNFTLFKHEKDFFANESINEDFFKTGESVYVQQFFSISQQSLELINNLKSKPQVKDIFIKSELDSLEKYIIRYSAYFEQATEVVLERGFRDYGQEGTMRTSIHKIEYQYPEFEKELLLQIRRNEKDFFLRKDPIYLVEIRKLINKAASRNYGKNSRRQKEIATEIEQYYYSFRKIVYLDSSLGNTSKEGLKFALRNSFSYIDNAQNAIWHKVVYESLQKLNRMYVMLLITLLVCIVTSLLFSLFFSKIISEPITELRAYLRKFIKSKFTYMDELELSTGIQEFNVIENDIRQLTDALQEYALEIQQSNKKLQDHNEKLESLFHELQLAYDRLKLSEEALIKSNNIKEKFLSIISHDVRGPLNTLKGYLSIMTNYPDAMTDKDKQALVKKVHYSVDLQLSMLDNMLQWARAQTGDIRFKPEALSLKDEIMGVIHLLSPSAEAKNIHLDFIGNESYKVMADKNMLELILRNLISNSLKFTKMGGQVTVQVDSKEEWVWVSIEDNGVGMSEDNIKAIMSGKEHFTTEGTNNEKGTGFGLLFCYEFVRKNEGQMEIQSSLDIGTKISFSLRRVFD